MKALGVAGSHLLLQGALRSLPLLARKLQLSHTIHMHIQTPELMQLPVSSGGPWGAALGVALGSGPAPMQPQKPGQVHGW